MCNMIEINGLKKYFKDVKAVDDISFRVKRGELFAFLGLNGAGKSTTISIMCGQLAKDAGTVVVDGADIEQDSSRIKSEIGIVFQNSRLDNVLSIRENLQIRAACYGITGRAFEERLKEIASLLHFQDLLKRPVGKLSGGQKRRIDIARAVFHNPKLLIMDEPTTGLDPQTRIMVWDFIANCRRQNGLTVFLTTHYMEEAGSADYVVILDNGKIAAEGTPLELKNTYTGDFIKLYGIDSKQLDDAGLSYTLENGHAKLFVKNTGQVKQLISQHPDLFEDFEVIKGNMDDVFLQVTGKELKQV